MRAYYGKLIFSTLLALLLITMGASGYSIYKTFTHRCEPPELVDWTPIPMMINGQERYLGVGIYGWNSEQEILQQLKQLDKLQRLKNKQKRKPPENRRKRLEKQNSK